MCLYCEAEKALKAQKAKTTTTKAGSNIRRITPAPTPTRIRIKSEQEGPTKQYSGSTHKGKSASMKNIGSWPSWPPM